jgi:hypothetical protein
VLDYCFSCFPHASRPQCWGGNFAGELGLGDTNHRGDEPNEMGDLLPPVELGLPPGF